MEVMKALSQRQMLQCFWKRENGLQRFGIDITFFKDERFERSFVGAIF